jgi:hypothetical protein
VSVSYVLICFCLLAASAVSAQQSAALSAPAANSVAAISEVETIAPAETATRLPVNSALESSSLSGAAPSVETPAEAALTSNPAGQQVRIVILDDQQAKETTQELIIEGLYSYGNYKIFASGYDIKLYDAGVEYNRHSWGYFLKAQSDYVAEFLPFVLLDKPLHVDIYGNPDPQKEKNIRQLVHGIGFSPIGFRLQWRSKKAVRPYLEAKGGVLVFDKKVPSSEATYENFSLQSAGGVQVKVSEKWGLRLGLFSDFHFSNAFIVPINPGLDVMNANLGLSYHF